MIKVLTKTLAILEEVVLASPNPVSLGKLAETVDINKATCSRIIGDLVAAGYLMQVSRLEGYAIGPRSYAFSQHVSYKEDILTEARPIVKACAESIGKSVLMAEMVNLKRYILCHYNYNSAMNVNIDKLSFDDLYETATGTMLLAYASKEDIEAVVERDSLPSGPFWESVKTRADLNMFLQNIREKACFVYSGPRPNNLAIAAFPVFKDGSFIATIGVSSPNNEFHGKHKEQVISEVKSAAEKISVAISHLGSIG